MRAALGLPRWLAALVVMAMLALAAGGLLARSLQRVAAAALRPIAAS